MRRVPAAELVPCDENFRVHPEAQREVMVGLLEEIGQVGTLLAYELPDGRLQLIDGHLRRDLLGDEEVDVCVVDLSPAEARKVLATYDGVTGLAEIDKEKFDALLRDIDIGSPAIQQMLADMAEAEGMYRSESALPAGADGREYDESAADDVEMCECPKCGHKFPA